MLESIFQNCFKLSEYVTTSFTSVTNFEKSIQARLDILDLFNTCVSVDESIVAYTEGIVPWFSL